LKYSPIILKNLKEYLEVNLNSQIEKISTDTGIDFQSIKKFKIGYSDISSVNKSTLMIEVLQNNLNRQEGIKTKQVILFMHSVQSKAEKLELELEAYEDAIQMLIDTDRDFSNLCFEVDSDESVKEINHQSCKGMVAVKLNLKIEI